MIESPVGEGRIPNLAIICSPSGSSREEVLPNKMPHRHTSYTDFPSLFQFQRKESVNPLNKTERLKTILWKHPVSTYTAVVGTAATKSQKLVGEQCVVVGLEQTDIVPVGLGKCCVKTILCRHCGKTWEAVCKLGHVTWWLSPAGMQPFGNLSNNCKALLCSLKCLCVGNQIAVSDYV